MENLNDHEIIERVLGGDTEAFGTLVGRYSAKIFSLVCRICGRREDAEEVVQDTFLRAYTHLGRFRRASSFSSWIYRIAYNTAISHTRKNRPSLFISAGQEERIGADEEGGLQGQGDESREEQLERLERALEKLQPEERALLLLFYTEDKPVREISQITGYSESNVKTRLHRIRKRLEAIYGKI